MRGTKAKEFRKLAAEIHELQPPRSHRRRNNTQQAMTSDQRHTYQWLKGRRATS